MAQRIALPDSIHDFTLGGGTARAGDFGTPTFNNGVTYDPATGTHNAAAARRGQLDTLTLALNHDFGDAKLWAMVGQSRYDQFVLSQRAKSREWSVGVTVPWGGNWLFKVSVAGSDSPQLQGRDIGVGTELHHLLSKRTTAYAGYTTGDGKTAGVKTSEASLYAVGVRHAF